MRSYVRNPIDGLLYPVLCGFYNVSIRLFMVNAGLRGTLCEQKTNIQ